MIKLTKHLRFDEVHSNTTKRNFCIYNIMNQGLIGYINWYPKWRKYVLTSATNIIYDTKCLEDITKFIHDIEALDKVNAPK